MPRAQKIFEAVEGAIGGAQYDMNKQIDRSFLTGPKNYDGDFQYLDDNQNQNPNQVPNQPQQGGKKKGMFARFAEKVSTFLSRKGKK